MESKDFCEKFSKMMNSSTAFDGKSLNHFSLIIIQLQLMCTLMNSITKKIDMQASGGVVIFYIKDESGLFHQESFATGELPPEVRKQIDESGQKVEDGVATA